MASGFGWVDFVEDDRQKMMELIRSCQEPGTVDELGIGAIRDAFADFFFPGTSTIQTRARYFLFIPWMYSRLEDKKIPSNQVGRRARGEEIKLINTLLASNDDRGVIGKVARENLVRLPSNIYWNGLEAWGIRLWGGSQEEYHRRLDRFYQFRISSREEKEPEAGTMPHNWHPGLPSPPGDFPDQAEFTLTREEAAYLQERVLLRHRESLLALLVVQTEHVGSDFIWNHPLASEVPLPLQGEIHYAQNLSETIHGAALLYNLMLAELTKEEELLETYREMTSKWAEMVSACWSELSDWQSKLDGFWSGAALREARISRGTRAFVEDWLKIIFHVPSLKGLSDHEPARELIKFRELQLKGNRAKLTNQRAREQWQGASMINPMDFRWSNASRIVSDIIGGFGGKGGERCLRPIPAVPI